MREAIACLRSATFAIRTREDAAMLAHLLAGILPEPARGELALLELMMNAIEHGNLEIGGPRKQELVYAGALDAEVASRLADPVFAERVALVEVTRAPDRATFAITDAGPGFPWRERLGERGDIMAPSGRGLELARAWCTDLAFNDTGNTVIMRVSW